MVIFRYVNVYPRVVRNQTGEYTAYGDGPMTGTGKKENFQMRINR